MGGWWKIRGNAPDDAGIVDVDAKMDDEDIDGYGRGGQLTKCAIFDEKRGQCCVCHSTRLI